MSEIGKIKNWIESCSLLEGNTINVDYLKDDIYSYSIDRIPSNPIMKRTTDGTIEKRQITFDFTVQEPISSRAIDNLINSKFCEDLMEWVTEQNRIKNFPTIDGAFKIECTSPGYVLNKTDTTAIYIIQMKFEYYKSLI